MGAEPFKEPPLRGDGNPCYKPGYNGDRHMRMVWSIPIAATIVLLAGRLK